MKHLLSTAIAAVSIAAIAGDAGLTTTANATLRDGSTVRGEFAAKRISGTTLFADKLDLDPALVKSLAFSGTNGESKVELVNGDKFAMTVANESFLIKSLLGELKIPRTSFRCLSLSTRKAASASGNGTADGLVFYCTFDDEAALASPVVGQPVKLELGQLFADKGKVGGALFVKPGIAGAEVNIPQGTLGAEGCIEFWASMASGKTEFSTGGDPRFLVLFDGNGSEVSHFEFASNDGAGNSGLSGTFFGVRAQTNSGYSHLMPYSDVFKGEDYNGWHHYALTWTSTGISIFLDGKQVCAASGNIDAAAVANSAFTLDIPLNRRTGKSYNSKSAFFIDEFKIWNFAKREFDIQ